jgi:hypothetical protein
MESIQKTVHAHVVKTVSNFGLYLTKQGKDNQVFTLEELTAQLQSYVETLNEEFKAKKGKKKVATSSSDEEKPARELSPYMKFCKELRPRIKENFADLKTTDVTKLMGAAWRKVEGTVKDGDDVFNDQLDELDIYSIEIVRKSADSDKETKPKKVPKKEPKEPKEPKKDKETKKAKKPKALLDDSDEE